MDADSFYLQNPRALLVRKCFMVELCYLRNPETTQHTKKEIVAANIKEYFYWIYRQKNIPSTLNPQQLKLRYAKELQGKLRFERRRIPSGTNEVWKDFCNVEGVKKYVSVL
ncbi:MAG: hypothetical protein WC451_02635 [Patescibacteria group bacterium]